MGFDRRLTPARTDLAAAYLEGQIEAGRFVEGVMEQVIVGLADLRQAPRPDAALDTQLLFGEQFTVYDRSEGWAWGQSANDSYVGYIPEAALIGAREKATHRVNALRSYLYPAPDIKAPPLELLSLGAQVVVLETGLEARGTNGPFARVDGGYMYAAHLKGLNEPEEEFVSVAERFMGTPYLWGGRSSLGLDCSSMIQLAADACGIICPRDSDMIEESWGQALNSPPSPEHSMRGDLVFWKGHMGVMLDAEMLLHANAHHMAVAVEPLAGAIARIAANGGGDVTSVRRR